MGGWGNPLRGGCAHEADEEEGAEEEGRDDNTEAQKRQTEKTVEKKDEREWQDGEGEEE